MAQLISGAIDQWRKIGWLVDNSQALYFKETRDKNTFNLSKRARILSKDFVLPSAHLSTELIISLDDQVSCSIQFSQTKLNQYPDAIPRLSPILKGLRPPKKVNNINLEFLIDDSKIYVSSPNYRLVTSDESYGLSALATAILQQSYSEQSLFATIHAAALRLGNYDIIMPGVSGSGKSTLSAYLAANNWRYMGDDVVAIGGLENNDSAFVLPFSTSIGLKPGSWDLMTPYFPSIPSLTIIPYADRLAKFIPVEVHNRKILKDQINIIVFPRYKLDCRCTEIVPLSVNDTLNRIMNSGLTLGLTPEPKNIEKMIKFIKQTKSYEVTYSCLEEVKNTLRGLCGQ